MTAPSMAPSHLGRAAALAAVEVKLLLRNRTAAVSSVVLPVAVGLFFLISGNAPKNGDPQAWGAILAVQFAITLTMGVYLTATQTVVARRHSRVLKRMRTTGLSDAGLLTATVAPAVAIAVVQIALFVVADAIAGAPLPADPLLLVLAVLGGMALCVTAGFATSIVTSSPERAQITTLPLFFLMLGAVIAAPFLPAGTWWQAVLAVPGAPIGQLTMLAFTGGGWEAGLAGLPTALPGLAALVVWPVVFAVLAKRHFRWDPRT